MVVAWTVMNGTNWVALHVYILLALWSVRHQRLSYY